MALEIIKNIVEAEQKSEMIRIDALTQAEKISVEADKKCKEVYINAQKQIKIETKKLLEEAVELAQLEVNNILAGAQNSCETIEYNALKKMEQAVDVVIGKVVSVSGNS